MRSARTESGAGARSPSGSRDEDLTTRARIRDAAIELFGTNGVAATTVRQVAATVGVSAALVIHHFGSKDGLRQTCDGRVMDIFGESISQLQRGGPGNAIAQLGRKAELMPVARYLIRTLIDHGPMAQTLFDRVVTDTEQWLVTSVAAGQVRQADDEHARAKLLVTISLGIQILGPYLVPGFAAADRDAALISLVAGPTVELYTHGLFTSTDYLDALRTELGDVHPGGSPASAGKPGGKKQQ